jgi:hypothetical protein
MAPKKFKHKLRKYRQLGGKLKMWDFYRYHVKEKWGIQVILDNEIPIKKTPIKQESFPLPDIHDLPKDKFDFCKSLFEIITNVIVSHSNPHGAGLFA